MTATSARRLFLPVTTFVVLLGTLLFSAAAYGEEPHAAGGHEPEVAVGSAKPAHTAHTAADEPKLIQNFGLPQALTTLTTLVVFIGLVAILGKYAWGPISGGLKAREDKIRKDIRDAEEARLKSQQTLKEYQAQLATAEKQVRDLIAKASNDAHQIATNIKMHAQQEAEESKERAAREIEGAKNQALSEIYDQAAMLATTVAEKILRRNLNVDDQRALVQQSLEQLKAVEA